VRHFFEIRREEAPYLWAYAEDIEVQRDMERRLKASFDADGRLVDEASPELARLREKSRRLADSLRTRIEARLATAEIQEVVQDNYYTQREGRYVLPVKASNRSRVDGIVHATSASGQTVFVEPAELVELNNALRISDFGIEAEELRILQMLSQMVGQHREAFLSNARRCLYIDAADAVARFALDCQCHIPDISDNEIELYQARHPLLALRKAENHFNSPTAQLWQKGHELGVPNEMNFTMDSRLIYCLQNGLALDIDVYDAAEWSCLAELSRQSVQSGSIPVRIPDFTRGRWKDPNFNK
jgi:DNA mismatch repair protein MutS2